MRTLCSNPNKSEKEQSFLKTFLAARGDLHIEKYDKGESPDYILYVLQERIGLEVTALVRDEFAAIRTGQDKCLQKATELARQNGLPIVNVKVKFRSDHDRIDIDKAAKELVGFVEEKVPELDDTKSWHDYESGLIYSKWISIHLGTVNGRKWLTDYRFERINMNWMRIDPIDEIQSRIDEKQLRIPNYIQKCDKCWLLIGVDEWMAPEAVVITEELESHVFSGDFRRLFFLRNIEGSVIELRISSHI